MQSDIAPFHVVRITTGFEDPLFLTALPGDADRVFIVEKDGRIEILDLASGEVAETPFLNLVGELSTNGERGLLGFAFAPDFSDSGEFYVNVTNLNGDTEIRRYTVQAENPDIADLFSAEILLTIAQPASNHNGGWLEFGDDGFLYIGSGDGGGPTAGDEDNPAQDTSSLLGAILRIDVSSDDFPGDPSRNYAIPAGNPLVGISGADEIFAWGLRNPYRSSFDRTTGDLYIGDVGQQDVEEIDRIPAGTNGQNFGWNAFEGTLANLSDEPDIGNTSFTAPIAEYLHGSGPFEGNSVTGGYVYRGSIEALNGEYFFGDFISGNIWSINVDGPSNGTLQGGDFTFRTEQTTPDQGTIDLITSFGEDATGELYIVDFDGDIFRLEPALAGGSANDLIEGTSAAELLLGRAGNDRLFGGAASDELNGGPGNDFAKGGSGNDTILGGDGRDRLVGASGNDTLLGGSGDDKLFGGSFADFVDGETGADEIIGGGGNDQVFGGAGRDRLFGASGDDHVEGGTENDFLKGGDGDDTLVGGAGSDTLRGSDGDDRLLGGELTDRLRGDRGDDTLTGGDGADRFLFGDELDDENSDVDLITDYSISEDRIQLMGISVSGQQVMDARDLELTLSTGDRVILEGVTEPLNQDQFV